MYCFTYNRVLFVRALEFLHIELYIHREAYLKEMCILIDCCWIEKLNELNPSLVLYEILQLIGLCCIT